LTRGAVGPVAAFFTALTAAAPRDGLADALFRPEDLRAEEREEVFRPAFRAVPPRLRPRADPRLADFLADPDRLADFRALERRAAPLFRPPDFFDVAMTNSVIGWFGRAN